jgi:hypothetical protein
MGRGVIFKLTICISIFEIYLQIFILIPLILKGILDTVQFDLLFILKPLRRGLI